MKVYYAVRVLPHAWVYSAGGTFWGYRKAQRHHFNLRSEALAAMSHCSSASTRLVKVTVHPRGECVIRWQGLGDTFYLGKTGRWVFDRKHAARFFSRRRAQGLVDRLPKDGSDIQVMAV